MPGQQTVELIIAPGRRALRECFIVIPGIIEVKIVFGPALRPPSFPAQVVFSIRKTWSGAVVDAGLDSGQARINVELGKGIDVLLSCLVRCLEIVSDVLKGLSKLGVVHVGRLKGAAFGVFAL